MALGDILELLLPYIPSDLLANHSSPFFGPTKCDKALVNICYILNVQLANQ